MLLCGVRVIFSGISRLVIFKFKLRLRSIAVPRLDQLDLHFKEVGLTLLDGSRHLGLLATLSRVGHLSCK